MNENLDLTKILKDCPVGTKFYSSYLGKDVFFIGIHNNDIECKYPPKIDSPFDCMIEFRKNGSLCKEGECMLFPSKDQRDWSKWQRHFKDGDTIVSGFGNIAIFSHSKKNDKGRNIVYYHCLYSKGSVCKFKAGINCGIGYVEDCKLATEYERELMMDAVRKNGYKWNAETKTLEKLIVPKFKVGDRIKHRLTGDVYKVVFILSNECGGGVYNVLTTNEIGKSIDIEEQDNYELVPNKFDINTLNPFDKVLCRMNNDDIWGISLFERYAPTNPYPFFCIQDCFSQCVPYNDDTKHLVGTNNEAPEYYRCWED